MKSSPFLEAAKKARELDSQPPETAPESTKPVFKTYTPEQLENIRARAQSLLSKHQHLVVNYLRADGGETFVDGATVEHLVEAAHSPYIKITTASGELIKETGQAPEPVELDDVWHLLTETERADLDALFNK